MERKPLALTVLDVLSALSLLIATYLALFYAPTEAVMGAVQRVFYFHVATAWVGLLGFLAAGFAGVMYLVRHDLKWDVIEVAAVEISLVFFFIAIALGSIWARPVWNTWWTWDPRLTTAAITELVYLAYFMLRQGIEEVERRARFGAVYTLVGAVSAPVTFMAIRLFRTIHPVLFGASSDAAKGEFSLAPGMRVAFFFALFTFTILFVDLFWHRIRLGRLAARVDQARLQAG